MTQDNLSEARSSHRRYPVKKGVLKNFANFTAKHLCWSIFLIKRRLQACNFVKKRLQHWCFPVKFAKFLITSVLKNISGGCFYRDINRVKNAALQMFDRVLSGPQKCSAEQLSNKISLGFQENIHGEAPYRSYISNAGMLLR